MPSVALTADDQQVWQKVLSAKNSVRFPPMQRRHTDRKSMTQAQITLACPSIGAKHLTTSLRVLLDGVSPSFPQIPMLRV